MKKLILTILLISSYSLAEETNQQKYELAYSKLGESVYIASGTQNSLNELAKSYENKIDKKYKPILGWTVGVIDSIIKNRIQIKIGFP